MLKKGDYYLPMSNYPFFCLSIYFYHNHHDTFSKQSIKEVSSGEMVGCDVCRWRKRKFSFFPSSFSSFNNEYFLEVVLYQI